MEHWILVIQDVWRVLRWALPPMLFMFTGLASAASSAGDKDADGLCIISAVIGLAVYIAAMKGWGL